MKRAFLIALLICCLTSLACGLSTPTPAPTLTPVLPPTTAVPTDTPQVAVTQPTLTPLAPTVTSSPASPATATATQQPPTLTPTDSPTTTPSQTPSPSISCDVLPAGNFLSIWQNNPSLQAALACPTSNHPRVTPDAWEVGTAYQTFEHGSMIWSDHIGWYEQKVVYVLYADGSYLRFEDTFDPGLDPTSGGETPPAGLFEPLYGFGKVWREQPGVRAALGWATAGEVGGSGRFQLFMGGDMIWISQTNQTYAFTFGNSTVTVFNTPFQ